MSNMRSQNRKNVSPGIVIAILAFLLVVFFLVSFSLGRYGVPVSQVTKILLSRVLPLAQSWTQEMEIVVINIRLPRIIMAILVGCCLAAAGAAYQGVFQNPMASPDILGASSGACFGAALAILLGFDSAMITGMAFISGLVTVALVFIISMHAPGLKVVNLILAGIMVSSLFSAATSYIKLVADPSDQLPSITYWLMGSLSGVKLKDILFSLIPMAIGLAVLFAVRWRINLLSLGDDEARALGINASSVRFFVILAATLITAASISASGMIGWVGLVIPHLFRKLVGGDYKHLMPASMLGGALFMLIVDNISRNLLAVEIPIGILTAFVGAPFFVYLLLRKEKTL